MKDNRLWQLDCDRVQGFYLAPPMPAAAIAQLMRQAPRMPVASVSAPLDRIARVPGAV